MTPGTRVVTRLGLGTVVYVRMAPPTFTAIEAVSVCLDARRADPGYTGTIFPVADVRPDGKRITMATPLRLTEAAYFEMERDMTGVCLSCGTTLEPVEPDAHGYPCPNADCRRMDVCGIEYLLSAELVLIGDDHAA